MPAPHEISAQKEAEIKRHNHGNFKEVEASRPAWDHASTFRYTQTVDPSWTFGGGANGSDPAAATAQHRAIDPYAAGRPQRANYTLLISAVVPRPIGFVSTLAADGRAANLAPFSFFQMLAHDPPLFVLGFACALADAKDTLRNLVDTRECVLNIISEGFVEAANATSVNAPFGLSEWDVSGLTPAHDCEVVKPARVREAVFSVEAKVESIREIESRANPGTISSTIVTVEGVRFWAREDAYDAERDVLDGAVSVSPCAPLPPLSPFSVFSLLFVPPTLCS